MRILIAKLSSFGDIIHAFPALTDLKAARPEIEVDWLVEEAYAPLVRRHPGVAEVHEGRAEAPALAAGPLASAHPPTPQPARKAPRPALRPGSRRAGPDEERRAQPSRRGPGGRLRQGIVP